MTTSLPIGLRHAGFIRANIVAENTNYPVVGSRKMGIVEIIAKDREGSLFDCMTKRADIANTVALVIARRDAG